MDWQRLAQAIIDRRVELGFRTRESFAAETGLSSRLLGDLERAQRDNFDRVTLARLEQALQWPSGAARAILTSGARVVDGVIHPARVPAEPGPPRQFLGPRLDPDEPLPDEVVDFLRLLRQFDPTLRAHALRMLAQFTTTLTVATTGGLPSVDEVLRMSEQRPNPDEPGVVRIPRR